MSWLADHQIRNRMSLPKGHASRLIITPFAEPTSLPDTVSWGLTSYGYDMRVGDTYMIFPEALKLIDPVTIKSEIKRLIAEGKFEVYKGDHCIIPPNSFALAESVEYFEIPRDCCCLVLGKSTYARCGLTLTLTPLEPQWRGYVTIEIANLTGRPAVVHSRQGIGQVMFGLGDEICESSYADKKSRYQDQSGLELPNTN